MRKGSSKYKLTKHCEVCFSPLTNRAAGAIYIKRRFCSKVCQYKGFVPHNKGKRIWYYAECLECKNPFVFSHSQKRKFCSEFCYAKSHTGEKSYQWLTDRSKIKRQHERNNPENKQWRMKVWQRDGFKCKIADSNCEGRIEAHHILGWSEYPELRYQINNGITLCHAHHPRKRAEEKRLVSEFQALVSVSNG